MPETLFQHRMAAHCENGVTAGLLAHRGLTVSEPMVFGIAAGLFYIYLPFFRGNNSPIFSYRPMPGRIFSRLCRRLGVQYEIRKFSSPADAKKALDQNLDRGVPTGLQVGVYALDYFPEKFRVHFSGHNLIAYGRTDTSYLISDPVMERPTTLKAAVMDKVRFAKGPVFSPEGLMFYPVRIPEKPDLGKAAIAGIRQVCFQMLFPGFFNGIAGIKRVAGQIPQWPDRFGIRQTNHDLIQMVRMQEEVGTGGAGFRFIYAAFLQEAAAVSGLPELKDLSLEMTEIADLWRDFAAHAVRIYRDRGARRNAYADLSQKLSDIARREETMHTRLLRTVSGRRAGTRTTAADFPGWKL